MTVLASVAVGRPVRGEFSYLIPPSLEGRLQIGHRVTVPFGRGTALGFYLGPAEEEGKGPYKSILNLLEAAPSLSVEMIELLRFAATHYRYPLGEAIRGAMPPGLACPEEVADPEPALQWFVRSVTNRDPGSKTAHRAPAQAAVLAYLDAVANWVPIEELSRAIPGARGKIKALVAKGWVQLESKAVVTGVREGLGQSRPARLTPGQKNAVDILIEAISERAFRPYLLHGVTGSGKTEVYLRAMEEVLRLRRGGLILVPEIALTPQLVGRFRSRFGSQIAVLHSGLREKERLRHWQSLRRGDVQIAVGVRSAIFAPIANLGLLVVDEEHDPSFKQEEKLRYQARDLAVVRAKQAGATLLLGSATPSLETIENVRKGRYRLIEMPHRVDDRPMPIISVIDLRLERPRPLIALDEMPILSPSLRQAMQEVLGQKQQVILFLNRRGHSTLLLCEVCGGSVRCQDCDVCLTLHLSSRSVLCHYCGFRGSVPERCVECTGPLLKLGIGTERVEVEVAQAFPAARIARLDRDAVSSSEKVTEMLSAFARRELDILVGTQMVAKGHDFPGVTLVAALMADGALSLPDFRASERTFHLLTQVAGRAGRGTEPGRVFIQTYNPECEPVRRVLNYDFAGFVEEELRRRRNLAYPPFMRMVSVRIEGEPAERVAMIARRLGQVAAKHLPHAERGVRLLGPAPSPLTKIRGKTRWQLLLKAPQHAAMEEPIAAIERCIPDVPSSVKVIIDVDPGAML